LSEVIIIIFK